MRDGSGLPWDGKDTVRPVEAVPRSGGTRVLRALESSDFRLLFAGRTVSLVGDAAFAVALGWRAFSLHGSGALGLVPMLESVGLVATLLVGGALGDRFERRTLMIASDLRRAAVVAGLAAADASGAPSLAVLAGCALGVGLGTGLFQPAFGGIVPLGVERGDALASANTLIGTSRQGSFMVGPALAGLLYGPIGPAGVFAADAASFVTSAAILLPARPRALEREPPGAMLSEIADGICYVASSRWLWVTIALFSVFLIIVLAPFQVLTPKLVQERFGLGVGAYGLLSTLMGAGMLTGTLAFGQTDPRRPPGGRATRSGA